MLATIKAANGVELLKVGQDYLAAPRSKVGLWHEVQQFERFAIGLL